MRRLRPAIFLVLVTLFACESKPRVHRVDVSVDLMGRPFDGPSFEVEIPDGWQPVVRHGATEFHNGATDGLELNMKFLFENIPATSDFAEHLEKKNSEVVSKSSWGPIKPFIHPETNDAFRHDFTLNAGERQFRGFTVDLLQNQTASYWLYAISPAEEFERFEPVFERTFRSLRFSRDH